MIAIPVLVRIHGRRQERGVQEHEDQPEKRPDQGRRGARGRTRSRHQARPMILPSSRRTSNSRYQRSSSASIKLVAIEEIAAASG